MVAKMAVTIAVLVMLLIGAALLLWDAQGEAKAMAKELDAALVRATNAEDRAKAEVRRASRSAAAADAGRRQAERELSEFLQTVIDPLLAAHAGALGETAELQV